MIANELRLEELLRAEYKTLVALTWGELTDKPRTNLLEQFERIKRKIHDLRGKLHMGPGHKVRFGRNGIPSRYNKHIRVEMAAPFESLIIPASYERFLEDFTKMAYNCIYCDHLDRNPRRLGRMNYKCKSKGKSCFEVLLSSGRLCPSYSGIALNEEPLERVIFYIQLDKARDIFRDIKSGEDEMKAKWQP